MKNPNYLGLSLSGGGYRAAAFHLGTLNKLNKLGILKEVEVLSTISGGSITGAAWMISHEEYGDFHKRMKNNLETKNVIKYVITRFRFLIVILPLIVGLLSSIVLSFTFYSYISYPLLGLIFFLLLRYQYEILPLSKLIEKAYDKFFYQGATLNSINKTTKIVIGTSNLHTGKPFTFSKDRMGDSIYNSAKIKFTTEGFPISRAVAASSCVPFAFSPVFIDKKFFVSEEDASKVRPQLIDGGVYDNQGLHKLTENKSSFSCAIVIVSDAGGSFLKESTYNNTISLLIRTVDLFMYRIKTFQMRKNIYWNVNGDERPIAYISLGWEPEKCITGFVTNLEQGSILPAIVKAHNLDPSWLQEISKPEKKFTCETQNKIVERLKQNIGFDTIPKLTLKEWTVACSVGTNLTSLSNDKVNYLIKHAEALTEIQVKLYCPML